MARITSKTKRVSASKTASEHLVFASETHERDKVAADRIREKMHLSIPHERGKSFPNACELSFQGHFLDESGYYHNQIDVFVGGSPVDGLKLENQTQFVDSNLKIKNICSWYLRKDKRPGRKPRKEKTGIFEINVSLGAAWSRTFAQGIDSCNGKNPARKKDIQQVLIRIGKKGVQKAVELSGYIPAYLACHLDSRNQISFHIGLSPVNPVTHELVGISANGKRGKKGLSNLGDAFMCILRNNSYLNMPDDVVKMPLFALESGRKADWEIGKAMELEAYNSYKSTVREKVNDNGRAAAREWLEKFEKVNDTGRIKELHSENTSLREEIRKLLEENLKLKKHSKALTHNQKPPEKSDELEMRL